MAFASGFVMTSLAELSRSVADMLPSKYLRLGPVGSGTGVPYRDWHHSHLPCGSSSGAVLVWPCLNVSACLIIAFKQAERS